jgi:uncharacterized membrane protein YfcA
MTIIVGGHPLFLPYLAGLGLLVGYIAGLFGIGGGFLLTPMLMSVFGVPAPIAVGSALSQKCGTSISSFLKYRQLGFGEPRVDFVMLGGSLIGVDAGTRILSYLDGLGNIKVGSGQLPIVRLAIDLLFIAILTFVAVYTLVEVRKSFKSSVVRGDKTIPGPLARLKIPPYIDLPKVGLRVSIPVLAYVGFMLGVASGVMGIGGGVLFMPILLYGFGFSARHAAGTGLLLLFATVAVGTFEQGLRGFVDLRLALGILIGSSIGSQLGALTTTRVRNRSLRLAFALLVGATVVFIVADALPYTALI